MPTTGQAEATLSFFGANDLIGNLHAFLKLEDVWHLSLANGPTAGVAERTLRRCLDRSTILDTLPVWFKLQKRASLQTGTAHEVDASNCLHYRDWLAKSKNSFAQACQQLTFSQWGRLGAKPLRAPLAYLLVVKKLDKKDWLAQREALTRQGLLCQYGRCGNLHTWQGEDGHFCQFHARSRVRKGQSVMEESLRQRLLTQVRSVMVESRARAREREAQLQEVRRQEAQREARRHEARQQEARRQEGLEYECLEYEC